MKRAYIFGDEAGNYDFSGGQGASKYLIIGTNALENPEIGEALLRLRRDLAWEGLALETSFHATEDTQAVRNKVFDVIRNADFRFDATILDKSKTQVQLQRDWERFYKTAWFLHFKYVCPQVVSSEDEFILTAAAIGTSRRRKALRLSIEDVVQQVSPSTKWRVAFWASESDPCLQIADYCVWAIQRKYEHGDDRSYQHIRSKLMSEFEPFK